MNIREKVRMLERILRNPVGWLVGLIVVLVLVQAYLGTIILLLSYLLLEPRLWPVFLLGADGAFGHACGVRVDGPLARGLWPPAGGRLCRRVVDTPFGREGSKGSEGSKGGGGG